MSILKTLFTFCLLLISLSLALGDRESVVDFCVANLNLPKTPAGYPCRNPVNLTVNDFVYTGFRNPPPLIPSLNVGATFAIDTSFPALNGLGHSMVRADIGVNGAVPVHTHRATEVLIVIEGTILSGFIASDNKPYYQTLNKGDVVVIPPALLHFQVNIGSIPTLTYSSFNSANPGILLVPPSLFGNDLPTDFIKRTTLITAAEVQRIKRIFGGSN